MEKENFYNVYQWIKRKCIRFSYVIAMFLGTGIFFLAARKVDYDYINLSDVSNISAMLAGFLFTAMSIFIALPDNKFTSYIQKNGYMVVILRTLLWGIASLTLSAILGIMKVNACHMVLLLFMVGLCEAALSAYYLYKVTLLSAKSK